MTRSTFLEAALALACVAGAVRAQAQTGGEPALRDPDRGLDPALRAVLALVDPARDDREVEVQAARIDARLRVLAGLWSDGRIAEGLASDSWIAPELTVPALFAARDSGANPESTGEWSVQRQAKWPADASERSSFSKALAAWRAEFPRESRLDLEVFEIAGEPSALEAKLRLTASGPGAGDTREQHNATWSSTWALDDSGATLVGVQPLAFEAVTLRGHPQGLFTDVTEAVVGEELFRKDLGRGLDEWRRTIPAPLFPGSLGHHGLALGDVNGDGLDDVYLCRPGGLPNELLLHTESDGLADVSDTSGVDLLDYSSSALLADLDGDADADLVVATGSGLVFFANDGQARFEERARFGRSLATSLAAADYDADGDLDLYVCSYVSPYEKNGTPVPYQDARNGEPNVLLRNDGDWKLVDATAETGMDDRNVRFSLAAAWEDFDDDGDQDLYVANDFGEKHLYRNDGGRFRDVAGELAALDIGAGMGVTWGDADGDGWMDLYVTNLYSLAGSRLTARAGFRRGFGAAMERAFRDHALGNTLLHNEQGRAFRDVSDASGTNLGRWGWGAIFVDFDDDGALDLYAPDGFVTGERRDDLDSFFWRRVVLQSPDAAGGPEEAYRLGWRAIKRLVRQGWSWNGNERDAAFLNLGALRFADVASAAGLDLVDDTRAAARVDWDDDGDEDLLVTSRTAPMLRVLRNDGASGKRWIELTLRGKERTAVGARVELETEDGKRHLRTLRCGEGYLAQSTARLHFGLAHSSVRRLTVRWPSGEREEFGSPAAGAHYVLEQGSGSAVALPVRPARAPLRATPTERVSLPIPALAAARTVLPTPLPLPRLGLETADGRTAGLLGITMQGPRGTGKPLLLVVWSIDAPSARRELERLAAGAELLREAGFQVLALDVDSGAARARGAALLDEIAWPFSRGSATEEALQILELVQAALHDDAHALALPAAFLVDPGGRLCATYALGLDPGELRRDVGLFELTPEQRRAACVPFPGRWIAPPPDPFDEEVAAHLDAHGLTRAAAEYRLVRAEVRPLSAARFHYDQAVARQRAGRLDEAVTLYEKALEVDPGFALAAQDLAVALHQQGKLAEALTAYREALRLEPGHALTRSNLGSLYLALGDVESARKELAALRELQSDLAGALEERIRQFSKQ